MIRGVVFSMGCLTFGVPRRPFEVAMQIWEKRFYVRYGGDTIQLGLPFVIQADEMEDQLARLEKALVELA